MRSAPSSPFRSHGSPAAFVPHSTSFGDPLAITLRASDHTYWAGEERVIGATESLLELGLFDPSYYTVDARDRGSRVHERTAAMDRGGVAPSVLVEELGYCESWTRYCRLWRPEMLLVERPMWDPRRHVAGTTDRVALLRRAGFPVQLGILDKKTGVEEPWHRLQLSIYGLIVEAWLAVVVRRALATVPRVQHAIYLRADGGDPKVRVWPLDRRVEAVIAAAQLKRTIAPRSR